MRARELRPAARDAARALPSDAAAVLARALAGRRVLLVGAEELRPAIEATAREVHVAPLRDAAAPVRATDAVLVGEALADVSDPAAALAALADAAPDARLFVAFRNRVSASAVLRLLGDGVDAPGLVPAVVERWASDAALEVVTRDGVPAEPPALAPDAAERVELVLETVAPGAAHGWMLWELAPAATRAELVPELLTVVVRTHDPVRLPLLDQAVFSLACQQYRPLEIVVAMMPKDDAHVAAVRAILERHAHVGGYVHRVLAVPGEGDQRGRVMNAGIRAARGQFLAFLDDDDVVYPGHYAQLVDAIRSGPNGWAVSRVRLARFTRAGDELYCTEKSLFPAPAAFELTRLVRGNYIPNHAYVVDRTRLGRFRLAFSERVTRAEDYELLLRLSSVFRPAWVARVGAEYRVRDDGTNVNPIAEDPALARSEERLQWVSAERAHGEMKARWPVLFTMAEFEGEAPGGADLAPLPLDHPLRYRVADAVNALLKRLAPSWHPRLKRWTRQTIGRRW